MRRSQNNYAFIDTQNVHLGVLALGWRLDWRRFRVHLAETYAVSVAYQFVGYVPQFRHFYRALQRHGYVVVHKPVIYRRDGTPKGNVDAELVLQAMIDVEAYERAVVVTSDGDFSCLVRYLASLDKLCAVVTPNLLGCSSLLKAAAWAKIDSLEALRSGLSYRK